jgi:hypothetical protein
MSHEAKEAEKLLGSYRQNVVRFLGGLVLSILLLVMLFSHINSEEFLESWKRVSLVGAVLAILVHGLSLVLRIWRWKGLLDVSDCGLPPEASRSLIWDAAFFGWLMNLVVPVRAGELARPFVYSRGSGRPFPRILGTSLVERAADLASVALLGVLALTVLPGVERLPTWMPRAVGIGSGLALGALLVGLLLAKRAEELDSAAPRWLQALSSLREGMNSLRQPAAAFKLAYQSLGVWLLEALSVWLVLVTSGQPAPINLAFVHTIAVTMSVSVVTLPFGLGVEQGTTVGLLSFWDISGPDALALSLVLTFSALVWVVPGGLWAWWRQSSRRARPPGAN